MSNQTKAAEGGAVKSLLALFSKLGKKKKEKQEKPTAQAASADAGELKMGSSPQTPVDIADRSEANVLKGETKLVSEACTSKQETQPASDEQNEHTNSAPLEAQQPFVRQDRLLAALESTADQHLNGTRPSFNVADLSSLLFAQRTDTQSGNCMALPSRVADAFASGAQSGEGHAVQRVRTDGQQGSYLPYGTTTVGPIFSAQNNTNIDSTAIFGQNLQDMLYADYEMLDEDRLQSRLERISGKGYAAASGAVRRDHPTRAPHVPSLLGRQSSHPRTASQLDQLEPDWQQPSGGPQGAPVEVALSGGPQRVQPCAAQQEVDARELGCESRSEPLGQVQLPQLDQHLRPDSHRTQPHTQHQEHAARKEQQQQQFDVTSRGSGAAPAPQQPSGPSHPTCGGVGSGGSGGAASTCLKHVHPQTQHPHPQLQHLSPSSEAGAACQGADAHPGLETQTRLLQPPQTRNSLSLPPPPPSLPVLAQPGASQHAQHETRVTKGTERGSGAFPRPMAATATAAPGAPGEQPVPLSRPMKLTTACLAAYTTLYDFGADQSFQRALRRKMQSVYKWLHASDLTVPPDPRLEVSPPLPALQADSRSEAVVPSISHNASTLTAPAVGVGGATGQGPPAGALPGVMSRDANSSWVTIPADQSSGVADGGGRMLGQMMMEAAAPVDAAAVSPAVDAVAGQRSEFMAAHWMPNDSREGPGSRAGEGRQDGSQMADIHPKALQPPVLQHSHYHGGRIGHPLHNSNHAHRNQQQGFASEKAYSAATGAAGRLADGGGDGGQRPGGWHGMPHSEYDGAQLRPSVPHMLGASSGVDPPQRVFGSPAPQTAEGAIKAAPLGALLPSQPTYPSSLHTQPAAQPLQHSLSDLYGNSSALIAGTNLPPRVLAGSDEVPMTSLPAAAAPPPGGGGGLHEQSRVSRSGGGPHPSQAHAAAATAAVPARTKTIAVASHCPLELQPQSPGSSWSIDDFTLLKKLYEGSLSVVCQAQHKRCRRHVALKIYKRSRLHEMERFQLAREICLHIRIVHPHVVSLYAAWKDSKYVYLAMDWAPQGNMFDFMVARGGQLSEEEAARVVMRPLMSALAFLHSQHFIHRDVKLENLLLDASYQLKLADFGLAIDQKFEQANTRLGTFGYFAPEVLDCPLKKGPFDLKDMSVPGYDCRVDVWSAGVVAYEVLTGRAPFSASSPAKIIQAIRSRELDFPGISEEGRDFLRSTLIRDPDARPTAKQLLDHPWIVRHCGANAAAVAVGSLTPSATTTREVIKNPTPNRSGRDVGAGGGAAAGGVPNAAAGAGGAGNGSTGP